VGPRAGQDSAKNITPNGIRSPDRLARSLSLYRLSYPAQRNVCNLYIFNYVSLCNLVIHGKQYTKFESRNTTVKWNVKCSGNLVY
jgi:hypothetical protein